MVGYPPHPAQTPIETLQAGLRPVDFGPRLLARLMDGFLALIAQAGVGYLIWSILDRKIIDTLGIIGSIVFLLWIGFSLWAILGKGARLAGLFLGQRWVQVAGARKSGWAVLGKFLAQAGLGIVTLGIGEAIISMVSGKPPLRRTWFDRITGLVLVTGRPTGRVPAMQAPQVTDQVRQVQLPDHRPLPPVGAPAPFDFGPGSGTPARPGVPTPQPTQGPIADVGVGAVNAGFIASLPFGSSGEKVAPPHSPAERPQAPMVVRERTFGVDPEQPGGSPTAPPPPRPEAAQAADHTVLAPHEGVAAAPVPTLHLDDGTPIELSTSVVFGRDPLLPPDLASGRAYPLTDSTMQLSKTHVAIGADPGGVWVVDLFSTNGVRVAHGGGPAESIECGKPVVVGIGGRIEFGGRSVRVGAGRVGSGRVGSGRVGSEG